MYKFRGYIPFYLPDEKVELAKDFELDFIPPVGMRFSINDINYEVKYVFYDFDENKFTLLFDREHLEENERYIIEDLKKKGWE